MWMRFSDTTQGPDVHQRLRDRAIALIGDIRCEKILVALTGRQHVCLRRVLFLRVGSSAQRFVTGSDVICSSGSGATAICLTNGRSCAAISSTEADTPVANSPIATNDESRSSQCTSAIASKAHIACR
jgi:hypothetical protein